MTTIIGLILFSLILILAILYYHNSEGDKTLSINFIIFSSIVIIMIIVGKSLESGKKQGKKEAYINILKGKENPYKEIIRKDTLYVKKNKKNKN